MSVSHFGILQNGSDRAEPVGIVGKKGKQISKEVLCEQLIHGANIGSDRLDKLDCLLLDRSVDTVVVTCHERKTAPYRDPAHVDPKRTGSIGMDDGVSSIALVSLQADLAAQPVNFEILMKQKIGNFLIRLVAGVFCY